MNKFYQILSGSVLVLAASVFPLFGYVPPATSNNQNPNYQRETQYDIQNNYYRQPVYPVSPNYAYGYYGIGSPPPPTYDEAFPDDAAANQLYYELQNR